MYIVVSFGNFLTSKSSLKLVGEEFADCELDELERLGNNGLIQTLQNNNTVSLCQKEGSLLGRGKCLQEPTQLGHTVCEHVVSYYAELPKSTVRGTMYMYCWL